jgi:hypothetical protein
MNLAFCRTPFIVACDFDPLQIATKIELFIWNLGETEPTTPTKVLEKVTFSPTQYANYYNISPFVADKIEFIIKPAVNVKVKKYYKLDTDWIAEVEELNNIFTYGYSTGGGIFGIDFLALKSDREIKKYTFPNNFLLGDIIPTVDFLFDFDVYDHFRVLYSSALGSETIDYTGTGIELNRIPLAYTSAEFINGNFVYIQTFNGLSYDTIDSFRVVTECEPKFNPFIIRFVNDLGGIDQMNFFKKSTKSFEVKGNDYDITHFTTYPTTNPYLGQSQVFNKNGTQTIKLNSGWISESEVQLIKQISLSENLIMMDTVDASFVSVKLKNATFVEKTKLNDRVLNYEIELEYANPMINNIV